MWRYGLCVLLVGCAASSPPPPTLPGRAVPVHARPDPTLTPGKVLAVDAATICVRGYASQTRSVSAALKERVYKRYGIAHHQRGEYAIDHAISLELGGANDIENLWPQKTTGAWNSHDKDRLEAKLHQLICRGELPLPVAQAAMGGDWIAAYKKYVLKPDPKT